jgi:hypothetical protein
VGAQACPRHARRLGARGWAGRVARPGSPGRPADREALRLPARPDPLVQPVAITERCVIGDQIRVPAAWCDMTGCHSRFADPAALGETDNRARALAAGWGQDAYGRLVCPACRRGHRGPTARGTLARGPETAGAATPTGGRAGSLGRVCQSVRSLLARWYRGVSRGWHGGPRWRRTLLALATGSNGWTAPRHVAVRERRPMPRGPASRARPSAAHHSTPGRPPEPGHAHRRPARRR